MLILLPTTPSRQSMTMSAMLPPAMPRNSKNSTADRSALSSLAAHTPYPDIVDVWLTLDLTGTYQQLADAACTDGCTLATTSKVVLTLAQSWTAFQLFANIGGAVQ